MIARGWAVAALALALAGCATGDCTEARLYEKATTAGELRAPGELTVPEPDPAFRIPSVDVAQHEGHIRKRADGSCVSNPPPFQPPAEPEGGA